MRLMPFQFQLSQKYGLKSQILSSQNAFKNFLPLQLEKINHGIKLTYSHISH